MHDQKEEEEQKKTMTRTLGFQSFHLEQCLTATALTIHHLSDHSLLTHRRVTLLHGCPVLCAYPLHATDQDSPPSDAYPVKNRLTMPSPSHVSAPSAAPSPPNGNGDLDPADDTSPERQPALGHHHRKHISTSPHSTKPGTGYCTYRV
jgi:hypothetical protein